MWLTVTNRNFVVLAIAGMIFGITVGLSGGLTPYFNTYLWGLGTEQIGAIQLSALISALPAVILAPILARRFGKKRVCITLFFIAIFTLVAPISGKLLGLTPPSGSTALVFFLAANHMLVSGLSMMGFIIVTSMIADIVEETELRTGRRSEGLLFRRRHLPAEGLDRRGDLPGPAAPPLFPRRKRRCFSSAISPMNCGSLALALLSI